MTVLFQRMRIWQKLIMISVAFLLPITIMVWLIISGFNSQIRFAELEKDGCAYLKPLIELMDAIPQHQILVHRKLNGHSVPADQVQRVQDRIEGILSALALIDRKLGQELQFDSDALAKAKRVKASTVSQKWRDLKLKCESLKPDACDVLHDQLIADVQGMIVHAGDKSNLILDPDLDSYYLMNVVVIDIPQNQDRLARVIKLGEDILRRKAITQSERSQLDTQAAFLKEDGADRISNDSQTALREDENFYRTSEPLQKNIPPALHDYAAAADSFLTAIRSLATNEKEKEQPDPAEFVAAGTRARDAAFKMWNTSVAEMEILLQLRIASFQRDRTWSLVLSALAMAAAGTLVLSLMRSINRPLTLIISSLSASGEQVSSAAKQLTASSQQLANGASEQASSIEETSSSLEQLSSMTKKNAENASQAHVLVENTRQSAESADTVISEMNQAMTEIKAASDEVGKIIKAIDEIAFQTNLLALNAAVEAARAGDAGKGFAVVAEEVRNLAQRSSSAAKESAEKIEAAILKAKMGVETAKKVTATLNVIGVNVKKANNLVSDIAAASQEQAQGISQINIAVQEMDKVVQSNAANAEQSAAASEEMTSQAQAVGEAVDELARMVGIASRKQTARTAQRTTHKERTGLHIDPAPALHTRLSADGNSSKHRTHSELIASRESR